MAVTSHVYYQMGLSYLKDLISSLSSLLGVPNVKTSYRKSWPETLFLLLTFTFDPFLNVKWGYLTTKALYLLYFSIITDPQAGDSRCSSCLVLYVLFKLKNTLSSKLIFRLHSYTDDPIFSRHVLVTTSTQRILLQKSANGSASVMQIGQ